MSIKTKPDNLRAWERFKISTSPPRIKNKIKEIYRNFSYKPKNKQELAGSIRDSSERGVLEKGTLNMIEGALRVSTDQVRDVMIPRPQVVFVERNEKPQDFLPRVIKSSQKVFWGQGFIGLKRYNFIFECFCSHYNASRIL